MFFCLTGRCFCIIVECRMVFRWWRGWGGEKGVGEWGGGGWSHSPFISFPVPCVGVLSTGPSIKVLMSDDCLKAG